MSHDHCGHGTEMFSQEFWDERYRSTERVWSGQPNLRLVEQVTDLTPGAALDIGSGEGADAIWLAARGWRVTAFDVSMVALQRAARHAEQEGNEVAERISWQQADFRSWTSKRTFDLVSAQFMHLPRPDIEALHRQLAAAVRSGGSLLIVGHHPLDMESSVPRPDRPELFYTAEEVAASLDQDDWEILVADALARETVDPDGQPAKIHDAVLHARRLR